VVKRKPTCSDLALEVHSAEGCGLRGLEDGAGLSSQKNEHFVTLFDEMLAAMVYDELECINIGLETEFLSDETEFYVGLVPVRLLAI
jgi:hypothetical protein